MPGVRLGGLAADLPAVFVSPGAFTRSGQFEPFDLPRGIRGAGGTRDARFGQLGCIQQSAAYHGWRNLPCHGGWSLALAIAPAG